MLDILELDDDVIEEAASDSTGKRTLESNVYDCVIALAYLDKSKGGANSANIVLRTKDKREIKITEYVTSGTAKGGKPYYEKDGKKYPLPGYNKINDLCIRATGKKLAEQDAEEKPIKLYDFDAKKEVPQKRKILVDLIGKKITAGIVEVKQNKYSDKSKAIHVNEVFKWFDYETKMTSAEIDAKKAAPKFINDFKTLWAGKIKDEYVEQAGGSVSGIAGAPPAADDSIDVFGEDD